MARLFASRAVALLVTSGLIAPARCAIADDGVRCPSVDRSTPTLAEIDARRRLGFVREVMNDQAHRARQWSLAWAVAGLGLAAGNYTVAALAETADDRVDPIVGGTTSLFIPAALLVDPLDVMAHERTLEADLATLSKTSGARELCGTLARAERLFAESAEDEAFKAGVFTQLFVIGGNGAIALFLGLGFGHWKGALINGGGGLLISELQIMTQPTGATSALARYRRAELDPGAPTARGAPIRFAPWIAENVAGIAAFGTF